MWCTPRLIIWMTDRFFLNLTHLNILVSENLRNAAKFFSSGLHVDLRYIMMRLRKGIWLEINRPQLRPVKCWVWGFPAQEKRKENVENSIASHSLGWAARRRPFLLSPAVYWPYPTLPCPHGPCWATTTTTGGGGTHSHILWEEN